MNREKIEKTLFILPTCLFLLAISIFPFIYSVYLSTFQAKLTKMHRKFFIGWENYQILLFEDDIFLTAIKNTFVIAFSSITIEIILGFIMAKIFFEIRQIKGLKKKPSTSEALDWIKLLLAEDVPPEALRNTNKKDSIPPFYGALIKNEQDVHLFEQLIFMESRNR